jgi:hypothetical protein
MTIIRTNNILEVYERCKSLIEDKQELLVVLDIDDTVLSYIIGRKLVDVNVKKLIEMIYRHDPKN